MDPDELNGHLERATAAIWAVEVPLIDQLEGLLREIGDEAAHNFEAKAVPFSVEAAAAPKGMADIAAAWAKPTKDEVLGANALSKKVNGAIDTHLEDGLNGFAGAMPTCIPKYAKSGSLAAHVDLEKLEYLFESLDAAKAAGSGYRKYLDAIRAESGMSPTAARKALEAARRELGTFPKEAPAPAAVKRARGRAAVTPAEAGPTKVGTLEQAAAKGKADGVAAGKFLMRSDRAYPNGIAQAERAKAKREIQGALSARLEGSKAWQEYVERERADVIDVPGLKPPTSASKVKYLIDKWAETSADHDPIAQAMQKAAAEEFGIRHNTWDIHDLGASRRATYEKEYATNGPAYRAFLRAMYENTQEELAAAGVEGNVTLYRAMEAGRRAFGPGNLELQAMSSFTYYPGVTVGFGETSFATQVPVARIIGTARTGFGCLNEGEWVVLGAPKGVVDKAWVTETAYDYHLSPEGFWSYIEEKQSRKALRGSAAFVDDVWQVDTDADWIKRGKWDLLDVTDAESLCRYLAVNGTTPAEFRKREVYKANVEKLEWLAAWEGCDAPITAAIDPCDGIEIKWDVTSRFYGNTLARTGEHITAISENVRADVMGVIEKSYLEGATISDTAASIRELMEGSARGWAETIARTELNRLSNGASLDAVKLVGEASGVGYLKEWLTAPGAAHPRHELYEGLDGQTVELGEMFFVGGESLEYPGDPNGDPGETINCRCTLIYHDSGGHTSEAANDEADLAGSAAVTSTDVSPRIRSGMKPRSASERRQSVRASLTAATIAPTYPLTHGTLGELCFYEAVEKAGYASLDSSWWPTEARALSNGPNVIYRDGDACVVCVMPEGAIAHACLSRDSIRVNVAAASAEHARDVISAFRTLYPASFVTTEGDSRVPITFWSMSSWGPQPRLRRIESASWADIERNYTASVRSELAELMAWTEPPNAGQLMLWQGEPGTGKTWALRALASEWANWAEFHFITDPDAFFVDQPSYMIDVLLSDSYSAIDSDGAVFEENDAEGKWRVLILEDTGELLSANAKERYGQGLSRLLNVVDGMIGQGLKILALVTTNDELGDLNDAALRPGRLASQIVFSPLDPSEAAAWLGSDVEEGLTVAQLYERTKNGAEALEVDDAMPCANCEHTYADHSGACSIEGCACKGFSEESASEAALEPLEPVAVAPIVVSGNTSSFVLPSGVSAITLSFEPATAPLVPDTGTTDVPAPVDASMVRWNAVFAPEGKATDDGRIFAPGSITWRELPLTLMGLIVTEEGGHNGAEVCGRIDRIYRDESVTPTLIRAEGVFDSSEFGQEVGRLVGNKILRGNSVDLAVREYIVGNKADYVDENGFWIGNDAPEADILDVLFDGEDLVMVVTDGVIGMSTVCPFPAFEDGEISLAAAGIQFFIAADPGTNLRWNVRTNDSFTLCEGLTASAAGLVPVTPPREWFDVPEPDELTPLTIDADGRVSGHAWTWNECHIGIPNKCTVAPHTQTDYAHFLLKEVEVALDEEGDVTERIHCGTITLGTGHAGRSASAVEASEHYDNTGAAVADVVIVDGKHGGWICGALRPDVAAEKVRELRGAVLSGDWRSIGGNLELVGLLAVNVPGFPVPRTKAVVASSATDEEAHVVALIAAGKVIAEDAPFLDASDRARLRALAARADGGFEGLARLANKEEPS